MMLSVALVIFLSAGCGKTSDPAASVSSGRAVSVPADAALSTPQAQEALADFVTANPDVFVSPGPYESTTNILQASVSSQTSGQIQISRFNVDLDAKTYQLSYHFQSPDIDFREEWLWEGSFYRRPNGEWKVDQPTFKNFWGK